MSIQHLVLVLLLLSTILAVNAGPMAYVTCVKACLNGCIVGMTFIGAQFCVASCRTMCLTELTALTP